MIYGKDYFLGDILLIKLTHYGLKLSARLIGVRTTYESAGRKISLQLGDITVL